MKLILEVIIIFGIDYLKEHFNHHQRYIIVAVFSMFLPFYMCMGVVLFLFLRLLFNGEIKAAYQRIPKSQYIIYFCLLSLIVSLVYKNYLGAGICVGLFVFFSFILYYRMHASAELFEFILNCIVVMSVVSALYGLVEYIGILNSKDIDLFELQIFNSPKDRINSFFFNANYYAMMIEFFVCITFYKILKLDSAKEDFKKFFYYLCVIALNFFLLLLTGCRTAWPALFAGILVMLVLDKHYKTCACIALCFLCICIYFLLNPEQFPRVDNIVAYFMTRAKIWNVAWANIKLHPLFGEGPLTYMHIYQLYHGHPTQHAHSIYLDPLLCFGIVGLLAIGPYVKSTILKTYALFKSKLDKTLVALIGAFIVMIFVHGTMDYTIFFVQTGFLFLLITSSFDIYKKLNVE